MLVLVTPPGATLPVEIQNDVIVGTDMSGVTTEMTGTMLSWMQDHSADGLIFIGPPGAAKSAVGKAAGATAGIPTVAFDLSAMQSSLVGGSARDCVQRFRSSMRSRRGGAEPLDRDVQFDNEAFTKTA